MSDILMFNAMYNMNKHNKNNNTNTPIIRIVFVLFYFWSIFLSNNGSRSRFRHP